jgi:WD40 repeat protein
MVTGTGPDAAVFTVCVVDDTGQVLGLGILVGPGQVVTHRSVVAAQRGDPVGATPPVGSRVSVTFPQSATPDATYSTRVAHTGPHPHLIALVLTDANPPPDVFPAALPSEAPEAGSPVRFRTFHGSSPHLVTTVVIGRAAPDQLQMEPPSPEAPGVDTGSPVYVTARGDAVAGLLLPRVDDAGSGVRKAVTAEEIRRFWPAAFASRPQPHGVNLLHVSDLLISAAGLHDDELSGLLADIVGQARDNDLHPDLVVVSGDLTEAGDKGQLASAFNWLAMLTDALDLPRTSVVVVPGERDLNVRLQALERDRATVLAPLLTPPYPAMWRLFADAAARFYRDSDAAPFDPHRPWHLHADLNKRVVVAALNSVNSFSDHRADHTGEVTAAQADDIRARLLPYTERRWLRLGVIHHNPAGVDASERLQDAGPVSALLDDRSIDLLLHGHAGNQWDARHGMLGAGGPGRRYHLVRIASGRYSGHSGEFDQRQRIWTGRTISAEYNTAVAPEFNAAGDRAATDEFCGLVLDALAIRVPGVAVKQTSRVDGSLLRAGDLVVRALCGPVTVQEIEDTAAIARNLPRAHASIVHSGSQPSADLYALARDRGVRLYTRTAYQQVVDLDAVLEQERWMLADDRRHPAEHYLPQRFRLSTPADASSQNDDLAAEISAWFAEDTTPLIVVSGPAGSGKSALLHQLTRVLDTPTPLLIDVRRPVATRLSFDALLVGTLLTLGLNDLRVDRLHYLVAMGRIALLVDGLDELVSRSGRQAATTLMTELIRTTTESSKVVVVTRDPSLTAIATGTRTATLTPFTTDQAEKYLSRRLGAGPWFTWITRPADHNPRSLALLAELGPQRLRNLTTHQTDRTMLYRQLVDAWAHDEAARWPGPGDPPDLATWKQQGARQAVQIAQGMTSPDPGDFPDETVVDWLVAEAIAAELHSGDDTPLLRSARLTATAGEFLVELAKPQILAWADASHPPGSIANHNAIVIHELLDDAESDTAAADTDRQVRERTHLDDIRTGRIPGELQHVVGGPIQCLAYGDNGSLLAVGRGDVVELVDRETARIVRHLARHSSTVLGVTFHAEDQYVISGSEDGTVVLWETTTGQHVRDFVGHDDAVTAVAVSKTANLLVTASADGTVRIWNPDTGRPAGARMLRHRRSQPINEVSAIAIHPTDPIVVAGTRGDEVIGWNIVTGETLFDEEVHDSVTAVAFVPDGGFVTTTSGGQAIRWTDSGSQQEVLLATDSALTCVDVSADGDLIAVGSRTGGLQIRRMNEAGDWQSWTGHVEPVTAVALPASGRQITTAGQDGMLKTWNVRTRHLLRELENDTYWATGLAFHDDGDGRIRLAASTWDGTVIVWNLPDGTTESVLGKPSGALNGVAFSPDGDRIVAGQLLEPLAYIWQISSGRLQTLSGHYDGLTGVAFSPDGRLVATVAEDHSFIVWDSEGHALHRRPERLEGKRSQAVTCLAFHDDSARLAVGHGRDVRIWNAESGNELAEMRLKHERTLSAVAFVPSTNKIVTAARDKRAWIWDLTRPDRPFATLEWHIGSVNCLAVSSDGALVATGSSDNTARIFLTGNGERLTKLTGHAGGLTAVAFAPHSRVLATAARDNTIRLWNVDADEEIATIYLLRDGASVVVRSDGAYRINGDPGAGVWWVAGLRHFPLQELDMGGAGPRLLSDGEPVIPEDLIRE